MANGERQQEPFSNRVVWIGLGVRVLVYKCGVSVQAQLGCVMGGLIGFWHSLSTGIETGLRYRICMSFSPASKRNRTRGPCMPGTCVFFRLFLPRLWPVCGCGQLGTV